LFCIQWFKESENDIEASIIKRMISLAMR